MRHHNKVLVVFGLSCLFAGQGNLVLAQQPNTAPNSGTFLQDLQRKTVPSELRPDTQRQTPPKSDVEDQQKQQKPPEEQSNVKKVFIQKIELSHMTLLPAAQVHAIIAAYENKDNSFAELQTLTDKLTELYRVRGLVTSRVFIPPQKLQNGTLKLEALEGHMGKLIVNKGKYYHPRSIRPK